MQSGMHDDGAAAAGGCGPRERQCRGNAAKPRDGRSRRALGPPATANVPPETTANSASPRRRTAAIEPQGPIDPKSAEAAGQVVQKYGALIEQGRWTKSWRLLVQPGRGELPIASWRDDRRQSIWKSAISAIPRARQGQSTSPSRSPFTGRQRRWIVPPRRGCDPAPGQRCSGFDRSAAPLAHRADRLEVSG